MLRVLQIVIIHPQKSGPHAGITGPERRAANLLPLWCDEGVEPIVCYPRRGSLWNQIADSGEIVIDFEISGKMNFSSVFKIAKIAKENQVNLIHTQGSPALDLLACVGGLLARVPVVVTRPVMIEDQLSYSWIRRSIYSFFDRFITLKLATRIVAVSEAGIRHLDRRCHARQEKLRLIYNGINLSKFSPCLPSTSRGLPEETPVTIGMIGQLYSAKGWPDFIDVIGHLFEDGFNIRAMIVGEGELRHELEQRVLNRGLQKHIEFTGFQSNIPEILHRLDIFLLTSHTEGLPVVIIEAMASGLPVVATDIAGIGEQVEDGENGFLVQVGDTEKIAALCARLIRNPEMRSFMGKTSRAIAEKKFSEDRMLHEYVACYKGAKSLHNTKKRPQSKLGKSYPQ